jgi:acetyl esterase/lipase
VLSDSLIVHIHGGGFVAQTASSHLMHLSEWAKDTGAPIVTINYRLAPGMISFKSYITRVSLSYCLHRMLLCLRLGSYKL